jgi:hypothetical protein
VDKLQQAHAGRLIGRKEGAVPARDGEGGDRRLRKAWGRGLERFHAAEQELFGRDASGQRGQEGEDDVVDVQEADDVGDAALVEKKGTGEKEGEGKVAQQDGNG